mmetsp:Transcript_24385/g.47399  ORF Transcript_24385/g.47399 Transcript_24385/m.47399 type:complete len:230 (+) Transcript_24385:873-1562(+)
MPTSAQSMLRRYSSSSCKLITENMPSPSTDPLPTKPPGGTTSLQRTLAACDQPPIPLAIHRRTGMDMRPTCSSPELNFEGVVTCSSMLSRCFSVAPRRHRMAICTRLALRHIFPADLICPSGMYHADIACSLQPCMAAIETISSAVASLNSSRSPASNAFEPSPTVQDTTAGGIIALSSPELCALWPRSGPSPESLMQTVNLSLSSSPAWLHPCLLPCVSPVKPAEGSM